MSCGMNPIGAGVVNAPDPKRRNSAKVFQNCAIHPHLTLRQHMAFGPITLTRSRDHKAARVAEAAAIPGLNPLLVRRPATLSGGHRPRVVIGRAKKRYAAAFPFDQSPFHLGAQLQAQVRRRRWPRLRPWHAAPSHSAPCGDARVAVGIDVI
jgi:multiple sugar transport system ATP-binding protein